MVRALVRRNVALFFKDKGMFFTSLITPMILLVLYVSFLGDVYRDSFEQLFSAFQTSVPEKLLNAGVGGQLLSSLLAVSSVTVSFCANFLMVQDKALGTRADFSVSPVKPATLSLSYYLATVICTLIVSFFAALIGFGYLAIVGWYLSVADVFLVLLDVLLLVLFGTALSSIINFFLHTQGQISAVGTIVSSGYGFICGAYMPLSQMAPALQTAASFLPGTYGTSLLRNHLSRAVFGEMESLALPAEAVEEMKKLMDCRLFFFDTEVSQPAMFAILAGAVVIFLGIYLLLNLRARKQ